MPFTETNLTRAFLIDLERREDDFGSFACSVRSGSSKRGLNAKIVQEAPGRLADAVGAERHRRFRGETRLDDVLAAQAAEPLAGA